MTVVAVVAIVALAGVVVALLYAQARERREWVAERKRLTDRAIARHAGEVVALDRDRAQGKTQTEEPKLTEGLT